MTEGTDQQTSYEETISLKSDPKSIELCTTGLVEKFNSPVQGIDVRILHNLRTSRASGRKTMKARLRTLAVN